MRNVILQFSYRTDAKIYRQQAWGSGKCPLNCLNRFANYHRKFSLTPRSFALGAAIFLPCLAVAAPTTVTFSAVTEFVLAGTAFPAVGTLITGSVVFDYDPSKYTKSSLYFLGLDGYWYTYSGAPYNWSANFDGTSFSGPGFVSIDVMVNSIPRLTPLPAWQGDGVVFATKSLNVGYSVQLFGPVNSFSFAQDIPSPNILESFWTIGTLEVNDYNRIGHPTVLTARVTDISVSGVSAVPEPTELSMMLAGLGLMLMRGVRGKVRKIVG
jgi:hypothetical protein